MCIIYFLIPKLSHRIEKMRQEEMLFGVVFSAIIACLHCYGLLRQASRNILLIEMISSFQLCDFLVKCEREELNMIRYCDVLNMI